MRALVCLRSSNTQHYLHIGNEQRLRLIKLDNETTTGSLHTLRSALASFLVSTLSLGSRESLLGTPSRHFLLAQPCHD